MKRVLISIFLSAAATLSIAQNKTTDNVVGANHIISSNILGEERQLQVYLPSSYAEYEKEYPVLYVLDGQRFFLYAASLSQSFTHFERTPEFIVVGITNSYPQRFGHFGIGKEKFMAFVEDEVLPYINTTYRSTNENILFGWEYGGSFTFNTLLSKPSLFSSYIAASPFPIQEKVDELSTISAMDKHFYFSVSPDEYSVKHGISQLDALLSSKEIEELNWQYQSLEIEKHRSTGYPTLYHGLQHYFNYYPEFEVINLQKFMDAGGMEYAHYYNKQRALHYGFSVELSLWTKYTIVRSAFRADDFKQFEIFMNEMGNSSFITELVANGMSYGASLIAAFYEQNNQYDKAIEVYRILLKQHPDSKKLQIGLENALEIQKKK